MLSDGKLNTPTNQISPFEIIAFRIPDAAKVVGLSKSTLYDLAAAGKLKIIRVAGRSLIERAELQRLMTEARDSEAAIETGRGIGARKVHAIRAQRTATEADALGSVLARRRRRGRAATKANAAA